MKSETDVSWFRFFDCHNMASKIAELDALKRG